MSDFRTYITQTGFGLERDAKLNNTHVPFLNLVVGDGKLNDASTPAEQTGLINKIKSYPVTIEKDDIDPTVWVARAEIPASEGGFSIFEAGVETSDGHLYCYARQPGDYKPLLSEGLGKSYTIRLKFIPSNTDTIEIKIDPSVQFTTPTDLSNSSEAHVSAGDPHPQYQKKEGLTAAASRPVQINSVDDTAGALLAVGSFGLGSTVAPYVEDLALVLNAGMYAFNNTAKDTPCPYGFLNVMVRSGGEITQMVRSTDGVNYSRNRIGDKFTAWSVEVKALEIARENQFVNGHFAIWQLGEGPFSVNGYTADQWYFETLNTSLIRNHDLEGGIEFNVTSSSGELKLSQCIERLNVVKWRGRKMTVRFRCAINATFTGDLKLECFYSSSTDLNASVTHLIGSAQSTPSINEEGDIVLVIDVPSDALGLKLSLSPVSGQASGSQLKVRYGKLELGSYPTRADPSVYSDELRACQRFYADVQEAHYTRLYSGGNCNADVYYPVEMRALPTVTPDFSGQVAFGVAIWPGTNDSVRKFHMNSGTSASYIAGYIADARL